MELLPAGTLFQREKKESVFWAKFWHNKINCAVITLTSSGFRGGSGGTFPLSGIRPPADPLYYFEKSICGWLTLNFFWRRLWRQIILILRLVWRFLVEIFQKVPKNAFFWPFFKYLPAAHKIWSNWGLFNALGEPTKWIWST